MLFDQRGAGRSRPKGRREANTLPHLIADMEAIREKFGFERWMIVGGSWGATLALAYAQAHPDRVTGIVLRATFLGTIQEIENGFLNVLPRFYPGLYDDFLSVLPEDERAQPIHAYFRRILDPDPDVNIPAARAWGETERILSEHAPNRTRLDPAALNSSRGLPATPFMEAHYFANDCFMQPNQLLREAGRLERHSRHHRAGPLRPAVPAARPRTRWRAVARGRDPVRRRRRPHAVRSRRPRRRDEGDRGHGFQNQQVGIRKCRWPEKACC